MPRGHLVWRRAGAPARPGVGMQSFAPTGGSAELPASASPAAPRDEAIFLLHTAAEIEHALLVQYLYAAFSFGNPQKRALADGGDLDPDQHARVFGATGWNETLVEIAIEEMFHLVTVQNALRVLGGPLNLEREDFPFRGDFYPFPFRLEPVGKDSLARYVAAEMPESPDPAKYPLMPEILERARLANHQGEINRVGRLYERVDQLLAQVPEAVFRPETATALQAHPDDWGGTQAPDLPADPRARILGLFGGTQVEAKQKVRAVLGLVAEQGEGPRSDASWSHFGLFYRMYSEFPETNPAFGSPPWHPALPAPTHPNTSPGELPAADQESGRITAAVALAWGQVFNSRYRMMLSFLAHYLATDSPAARGKLVAWATSEMRLLRQISDILTRVPQRAANPSRGGRAAVAGAPFELPYTLLVPDREVDRWQSQRDVVTAAGLALGGVPDDPETRTFVSSIRARDTRIMTDIDTLTETTLPDDSDGSGGSVIGFSEVIAILDSSVGGPAGPVGPPHRAFWRGLTRDQFVAKKVLGLGLVVIGNGAESNIVKSFKGEAPFDGSDFPRMPVGAPPLPADKIAALQRWIDAGCPETAPVPPPPALLAWRPTNAPVASSRTDDIWFIDPQVGWAVNSNGQIVKTTDGGNNWVEQLHDDEVYFRCIGFASATTGWAGTLTQTKRMYKTTNGGGTWEQVTNLPASAPSAVCGLSVVNPSVVYAAGTNFPNRPPRVLKTTDGGANWTGLDMGAHASLLIDIYFTTDKRGWVVGGKNQGGPPTRDNVKPVVLFTEDGGLTWVNRAAALLPTLPLGEWGWKIQFLDDQVGFVSLENFTAGAILKTTDGGQTWVRLPVNDPQGNANLEGVGFVDANHGWVGGWGDSDFTTGSSSETKDGGQTWRDANEIGKFINRFRFFGNPVTVGYASGLTVYKYSSDPVPPAPTGVAAPARTQFLAAARTAVGQPVTLPVQVPAGAERLSVRVWDRFGEHVAVLAEEANPAAGERQFVLPTDHAGMPPASAYIVRVTVDGMSESRIIPVLA